MTLDPAVVTDCDALAWSPDGRRFALICGDANQRTGGVYVMNIDGSDLHRVVDVDGVAASLDVVTGRNHDRLCQCELLSPGCLTRHLRRQSGRLRAASTNAPFRAPSSSPNWSTTS